MLFFKKVMDEKLVEPGFKDFYATECHICSITVKVIAALEEKEHNRSDILKTLNISEKAYEELKDAENCDPTLVMQLCDSLDLNTPGLFKECPKNKK